MLFDSISFLDAWQQKKSPELFLLTNTKKHRQGSISHSATSPSYVFLGPQHGGKRPNTKTYIDSVPDPILNHVVLFCLLQSKAKAKKISHMEYIQ
jgi:hypothetical protein